MRTIGQFSTRYPKTIMLIVLGMTVFFFYQMRANSYLESDMTKFLPTDIKAVKANDYYRKNFNYHRSYIIGIEAADQGIMTPSVLRAIERIVADLKAITTRKTIESKLTGKTETIELPIGIDTDDISSISGLEDGILDRETGAVITGSVIKKLKEEAGIFFNEANEELLPESDEDLLKIIPALKNHIIDNRLFRGNILSVDGKATAIHIPLISKWDYKRRYTSLELETALDPNQLKARFQGKTSFFPYAVYGKTIDGVVYDDTFIARHSKKVSERVRKHLIEYLEPAYPQYPKLKELLTGELSVDGFKEIIKITQKRDFFMNPHLLTWDIFTSKLWDFTLMQIDPLSYENLEFYLPHVEKIYDLLEMYDRTLEILERNSLPEIKTYVGGELVTVTAMFKVITRDMTLLLPIGLLVILFMLAISFRSVRGVAIPLITVVLTIIWTYGFMALTGTPITPNTSNVPVVLLAVGSAYGIHLLNRYLEDARKISDRREILRKSIQGVGAAILMAGITTFAGFLSLSSTSMIAIRHYSVFTAFGVIVALFLTFTLSPAILCYWRRPRQKRLTDNHEENRSSSILGRILVFLSSPVRNSPKIVIAVFVVIALVAAIKMKDLRFEGAMTENFRKNHPVRISAEFINRYLTGTGEIKLLFKFRDSVNLENKWARDQLQKRTKAFAVTWSEMYSDGTHVDDSVLNGFASEMIRIFQGPKSDIRKMERSIALMNDILNEEYIVEIQNESALEQETSDSDLGALIEEQTLANNNFEPGLDGLAGLAETGKPSPDTGLNAAFSDYSAGQVNGLKNLHQRLGQTEDRWEQTGKSIVRLRNLKSTPNGARVLYYWNELQDLFAADVKQPYVLNKLEKMREQLFALEEPKVEFEGGKVGPTGFAIGPVDLVRKTYSLFYHDEDPAYKKIPDTRVDNLGDPTLTDRSVIGVVLNQAQNSNRDTFNGMISPDLKEFQYSITARKTLTTFNAAYTEKIEEILSREFPDDNPYIESISIGGYNPVIMEITNLVTKSQVTSIAQAMIFILIITFFIFRSVLGGVYALIPLVFTVLANFGMILLLGWKIDVGTVMVAAISLGIGVDYTIHFLERFKAQLKQGDTFDQAYINTIRSSGVAIIINAASVAAGFAVLLLAAMANNRATGLLMVGTMGYSSLAALTLLPALIFVTKPKFLTKVAEKA